MCASDRAPRPNVVPQVSVVHMQRFAPQLRKSRPAFHKSRNQTKQHGGMHGHKALRAAKEKQAQRKKDKLERRRANRPSRALMAT